MSATAFANRGGWVHWRTMDPARREEQQDRTFGVLSEMLADPGRFEFPDFPVVLDRAEVPWEVCDLALSFAKRKPPGEQIMDRWLASLHGARRHIEGQRAAFLRGDDVEIASNAPSRLQRDRDRDALARLDVPLVLVTPCRAADAASGASGEAETA